MKKFVSVLLSIVSVFCLSFAFSGCGNNNGKEKNSSEAKGTFYDFAIAYERGMIDEFDLKSIACCYYEWRNFENNPYSGMFNSTKELSDEIKNEIIEDFYIFNNSRKDIKIIKYYGTYDGNIAVSVGYENINNEGIEGLDCEIDGVVFSDFRYYDYIYIYHRTEEKIACDGNLYGLKTAHENQWLSEDDLKSISCYCYDFFSDEENPYKGLYQKPVEKLSYETKLKIKSAYVSQIENNSYGSLDRVKYFKYCGTYNGNVVTLMSGYGCGPFGTPQEFQIGNVKFCSNIWLGIYVYHVS